MVANACGGAGGRLVVVLEGGYDLQGLSESVVETFLAMVERPSQHAPVLDACDKEPLEAVTAVLDEIAALHSL